MPKLSPRELDVVELVYAGKSNAQIGEILFISENTVRSHVSAALKKKELRNRTELAIWYAQKADGRMIRYTEPREMKGLVT